jgi:hypothetical protein
MHSSINSIARVTPAALFLGSIYNYRREIYPVVEDFSRYGWRVEPFSDGPAGHRMRRQKHTQASVA